MFLRRRVHLGAVCKIPYFLICSALTLWGQSTGGIQGTVTDSSGAPLANATVTVTNRATAQQQVIKSDNAGLYAAPALQPGTYSVRAAAPGLQTTTAANVVVSVSTLSRQDFTLGVATANTSIQIESTAPVIETTSSSLGAVVNQKTVQEIPLNGRHFVDLALLVPGSVTPPQNGFLTAPLRGQGSFSFNSAGGREDAVNFMINGINMNDISQNQVTFQPTIATVEEAKIDNSTFSAEYGRNSGSIVNIATRAGTNDLHGEAYEYLRNAALDARNYTNPKGVRQSPFVRNQFGGDTGFPIKRDKSFLYLSYEQLTQRQSLPINTVVLSAGQRATAAASSDAIVKALLPLIPAPNSSSNVFVGNAIAPVDIYQGTANFTQSFSASNRFNAYYAMQQDQRDEPTSGGNNLPNFGDMRHGVRQLLTLNDAQTISPTLVNEARAGYNRIHIVFAAQNTLNAADYGIDSGVNAPIGLPQISVSGAFALGGLSGYPQGRGDDTITTSDTLSWIHGNHSVKFGGEYRQSIADSFSETPGTFGFANVQAFLADQANSFSSNTSNRSNRVYIPAVGFFVQDAYKLRPNLTVTLGLRYDWNGTPTEAENRFVVFNPAADSLEHVGQGGGLAYAYNQSALNFQPHVGFAWDIGGDGKTIIRSAFATFVDQPNVGLVTGLVGNPPYSVPVSFSPTAAIPTVSFSDAYALAGGRIAPTSVAHNYRNATVDSWNFNIERQFGNDYGLTASYVGSKGSNLNIARNYNQPVNGILPYRRLSSSSPIDPGLPLSNITVYESDGNSSYQALWLTLQKRLARGLQFSGSYTWSKSIDENSRNIEGVVIQDSYNIRGDRGLSDYDARQRFVLSGVYDLPFHQNRLVDGWQISLIETLQSGNPITFFTSNRTLTGLTTVRPNVVAPLEIGLSPATNGAASFIGYLQDPLALKSSAGFGNLGRNAVIGPGFEDLDISLVKNTRTFERLTWQFRADAFDVFNHANFGQPGLTVGTQTLGLISSTRFPTGDSGSSRQLQLSMKLIF